MKNVGIVILSRYSSSRLPGKALKIIKGKPVLGYIFERLLAATDRARIILATSDEESDNPIADFASETNINCHRGSLNNVSKRFYDAANSMGWEYAIRINGDNIFIDIHLLRQVLKLSEKGTYNFISNVKHRTFPKGMSVESVFLPYYKSYLEQVSKSDEFKEHVMLHLYQKNVDLDKHLYVYNEQFPEASGIQMALDTAEDFERTKKIIDKFKKPHWQYNLKELIQLM